MHTLQDKQSKFKKDLPICFRNTFSTIFAFSLVIFASWHTGTFVFITAIQTIDSTITLELDRDTSIVVTLKLFIWVTFGNLDFIIGAILLVGKVTAVHLTIAFEIWN